jgi:non-ribosomal peptide synthetase component F
MLALCLSACLAIQDPAGNPPAAQDPPPPSFAEWDDRRAKEAIKEFQARMRARAPSLKERMDAVGLLAQGRNARLVEPLAKVVRGEKALTVRRAAAEALGHQPEKESRRALAALLADSALHEVPQVQAALVGSLARAGYEAGRDWKIVDGLFERDYAPERVPLQQAILRLIDEHEELEALDLLVQNLGEPIPADPDDPSNPPAEYWEARWKAWSAWRADVKAALLKITGQRFSTAEEARTWLRKNEAELRRRRQQK